MIALHDCLTTKKIELNITWAEIKGHLGQDQRNVYDIGRWAHINVKFLYFFFSICLKYSCEYPQINIYIPLAVFPF